MSRRTVLLIVSLTANVVLCVAGWQRYEAGKNESTLGEAVVAAPPVSTEDSSKEWDALVQDATDEDFVSRLRREGFPARVIRKLVALRVQDRYAERLRLLSEDRRPVPYWRNSLPIDKQERERGAAIRALKREMTKELRRLLGTGAFHLPGDYSYDYQERLFGNLPPEKIAEIEAINSDYREMEEEVLESAQRWRFPDDLEKLKFFERERRADLARLLAPSELEHYERRSSWSANGVQKELIHFDVTETEYLAMYEARRVFDERYGMQYVSREEEERRVAARAELLAAWKIALGPDRFEEFQLVTDNRFHALQSWVERNRLPTERAMDLMRVVRDLDGRKRALRENDGVPPVLRTAQDDVLLAEAASRVAGVVGEDKLTAFMEQAGDLLLKPPPPFSESPH